MKDTRFIELVNLYIDRQISPEETVELEAEIQSNPRRRQTYLQYCRMHHATKLVYESFRAHGDQPAPVANPGTVARFESRKRAVRQRWLYAVGGLAAAACLTFVVVRLNFAGSTGNGSAVPPALTKIAAVQPAASVERPAAQPPDKLTMDSDYAALLAALHQQEQRNLLLTQQQTAARLQSLFEDGVFDNRQILPQGQDSRRVYQPKGRLDQRQQAEFTAFQFQR